MLELYQFAWSPFCLKVRGILHVKDIPYKTIDLVPIIGQGKVRAASGQSKVPAIVHDGKVIVDSTDIALYLEEIAPTPSLIPEDRLLRSECLRWEDWSDEILSVPIRALGYWAVVQNPELGKNRVPPTGNFLIDLLLPKLTRPIAKRRCQKYGVTAETVEKEYAQLLRKLDDILPVIEAGPYLVGDSLSLADIAVCTVTSNLDVVERIRGRSELVGFFGYRDRVLGEIGL